MSDFTGHLPLSQRRAFDESRVSGDWRPVTAQCLHILADLLAQQAVTAWDTPSIRPGRTVREVVAELLWRAGTTPIAMLVERMKSIVRGPFISRPDVAQLAVMSPPELLLCLRALAAGRDEGVGRRGVGDLEIIVSHAVEVSRSLGVPLDLPAVATGAVCLARILTAPLPIRAAIAGRSLEATDAGWTVGHGRPILARAEEHVLFLYGRLSTLPGD